MKPLGDIVHDFLAPFVKGTKYATCDKCEKRRQKLNKFSTTISDWITTISCPCWWKSIFTRK